MGKNCYQCEGDLVEIQAARKAQIRAWADKQLADADKAFAKEVKADPKAPNEVSDWDILNTPLGDEQPVVEVEDADRGAVDALALSQEKDERADEDQAGAEKVAASPKPEGQAPTSDKDAEDNKDSSAVTAKADKADAKPAAKAKKDAAAK